MIKKVAMRKSKDNPNSSRGKSKKKKTTSQNIPFLIKYHSSSGQVLSNTGYQFIVRFTKLLIKSNPQNVTLCDC